MVPRWKENDMSIKGYELMKLVADNSDKYSNKTYKVVEGYARTPSGVYRKEINVNSIGNFEDYNGVSLYISTRTELEEIKKQVTPREAAKAYMEGKCIIYEFEGVKAAIQKGASGKNYSQDYFMTLIATGIWYIED